ncbi:hypothetical protein EK904_015218 [Melospiza melodia maxima]|nr:hypothetical protein EK904_015218 [Melospiza melodia maxima]
MRLLHGIPDLMLGWLGSASLSIRGDESSPHPSTCRCSTVINLAGDTFHLAFQFEFIILFKQSRR